MKAIVIAGLLLLTLNFSWAQSESSGNPQFEENVHYVVLPDEETTEPTVTEYFSLFCGHCFQFEGLITPFKAALPNGTAFEKSHVTYLPKGNDVVGQGIVRAFVAMEKLGKRDELSKAFFIRIHLEQKEIASLDDIKAVFLENEVSEADYESAFNDPEVVAEAAAMSELWMQKGIDSVPTLVINGKYRLIMNSVKNLDQLNALVTFLLEKK